MKSNLDKSSSGQGPNSLINIMRNDKLSTVRLVRRFVLLLFYAHSNKSQKPLDSRQSTVVNVVLNFISY